MKIDVSSVFPDVSEPVMGAYQNYLGGGIAGAVVGAAMFDPDEELNAKERKIFEGLKEKIKRYFYELNDGGGDEYMVENVNSYEQNQTLPTSAY